MLGSASMLAQTPPSEPPRILAQPVGVTLDAGFPASMSVTVSSNEPPAFQWFFQGAALVGETNAVLNFPAVRSDQAGDYTVQVFNSAGSVMSEAARLTVVNLPSSRDASFKVSKLQGVVTAVAVDAHGKILIGGGISGVSDASAVSLARLNPDGTADPTFIIPPNADSIIRKIVVAPDEKIYVGGDFTQFGGSPRVHLARLNADGSMDAGFIANIGSNGFVNVIGLQTDGKVLIGGTFDRVADQPRAGIARLLADGALDPDFQTEPGAGPLLGVGPSGEIVSAGTGSLPAMVKLQADGSIAPGWREAYKPATRFGFPIGRTGAIYIQRDGKVIFETVEEVSPPFGQNGYTCYCGSIRRLNSDGSLDKTFGATFDYLHSTFGFPTLNTIVEQADGKILIGGVFTAINDIPRNCFARLNRDGSLDQTFETFPEWIYHGHLVNEIALELGGRILVGSTFLFTEPIVRLIGGEKLPPGPIISKQPAHQTLAPLSGLALSVEAFGAPFSVQWYRNAKMVDGATSAFLTISSVTPSDAGRYFAVLWNSFGATTSSVSVVTTPSLIPKGTFDRNFHVQLTATANVNRFGLGPPWAAAVQEDGRILLSGDFGAINGVQKGRFVRLFPNASIDNSFVPPSIVPDNSIEQVLVLPQDSKIIIAGSLNSVGGVPRKRIARLEMNGALDQSFDPSQPATAAHLDELSTIRQLVRQSDGKLVAQVVSTNGATRRLIRFNVDGTLDDSYTVSESLYTFFGFTGTLAIQTDNKVLTVGQTEPVGQPVKPVLIRLNSDGTLDQSFHSGLAVDDLATKILVSPDGDFIVSTIRAPIPAFPDSSLSRLRSDGSRDANFKLPGTIIIRQLLGWSADGNILAIGYNFGTTRLLRILADGQIDPGFGAGVPLDERQGDDNLGYDETTWMPGVLNLGLGNSRMLVSRLFHSRSDFTYVNMNINIDSIYTDDLVYPPNLANAWLDAATFRGWVPAASNKVYNVEFKNSLDESDWTPLVRFRGEDLMREIADSAAGSAARFYRVRAE
ncbi:MAG: hypothetical protein HY043_17030 [Verrucomicrobia bacterium]|nr:hypothetical protein [Verrucomicrobiota bacterium]